jgi:hypothetical protein
MCVTEQYDVAADEANNVERQAVAFLAIFCVQNKNQYKISPKSEGAISLTALTALSFHIK